jgi:hypothetical protein
MKYLNKYFLKCRENNLNNKNKNFNRIKLYILLIIIIFIIFKSFVIISSSFKIKSIRKLSPYNPDYQETEYSENTQKNQKSKNSQQSEPINPVIIIFFVFFVLFLFLCLYIICELKRIAGERLTEEIREKVWIFIYFANNGFFFISISTSPMINDLSFGYITLSVSGIICIIGTVLFIKHIISISGGKCCENFIVLEILKSYFSIPTSYVWSFIALTDPCCLVTEYTVYQNSDGTVSSTKSCVECWNAFVYILKRIVMIISFILFYAFLIYLTILLLIIKLFHWIITQINDCSKKSGSNENENGNQVNQGNAGIIPNYGNVIVEQNPNNNAVAIVPNSNDINDVNAIQNINEYKINKEINENDINQINYMSNELINTQLRDNLPSPPANQEIEPIQIQVNQKEQVNA